jgi:hypothetical protein
LRKVFTKLDISSRNELDRVLPREPTSPRGLLQREVATRCADDPRSRPP